MASKEQPKIPYWQTTMTGEECMYIPTLCVSQTGITANIRQSTGLTWN